MSYWNEKQYWADGATRNCIWQFQTMHKQYPRGCACDLYDEDGELKDGLTEKDEARCDCYSREWLTQVVFLTQEEAIAWGESRPYAWGKQDEGWRIWGVPCCGKMAELLGRHTEEFESKVEYISKVVPKND